MYYLASCFRYINENKWTDALNLCRSTKEKALWACLAVLSIQSNADTIDTAEEAFANINHYDKVFYIQHIKASINNNYLHH